MRSWLRSRAWFAWGLLAALAVMGTLLYVGVHQLVAAVVGGIALGIVGYFIGEGR